MYKCYIKRRLSLSVFGRKSRRPDRLVVSKVIKGENSKSTVGFTKKKDIVDSLIPT